MLMTMKDSGLNFLVNQKEARSLSLSLSFLCSIIACQALNPEERISIRSRHTSVGDRTTG